MTSILQIHNNILLFLTTITLCYAEISTSNNQFGLELYCTLAPKHDGDFILSPFPLTTLLASLYAGGGGVDTVKEIGNSLKFSNGINVADIIRDYKRIIDDFSDVESLTSIDSALLINTSLQFSQDFESILQNDFKVDSITANISDFNATLEKTMDWVHNHGQIINNQTSNKLFTDNFNPNATLVLLSKSFFKASWVNKFHPSFTKPSPFFYDETHANQVDMMFQRAHVPFAEISELDCTAVSLPYKTSSSNETTSSDYDGHRLELIILLPNSRMGLPDLERKLKDYPFSRITQRFLETKDIFLYIPKFNASSVMDLTPFISEVGIRTLTNPKKVDLAKITGGDEKVRISNIFHFAEFAVDENGSNGENTTIPFPNFAIKYNSPETFRANRPFIGILYDQENHIIINIFRKIS